MTRHFLHWYLKKLANKLDDTLNKKLAFGVDDETIWLELLRWMVFFVFEESYVGFREEIAWVG